MESREFSYNDSDFEQVRRILYGKTGINLSTSKQQMVYSRLARRIRTLQLKNFSTYLQYLEQQPDEMEQFVNALTTNLTSFFREAHHFDILAAHAQKVWQKKRVFRCWCSASSTGEEPYSIAMTLAETYGSFDLPIEIIASDIDSKVLVEAAQGIYSMTRVESLSDVRKKQFLHRGKGANSGSVRIVPELRAHVDFRQINLLDPDWQLKGLFDAIFCRNVMIYFDKTTQLNILERMTHLLQPDGLYIAGHSESFMHAGHLVKLVGKSTYQLAKRE